MSTKSLSPVLDNALAGIPKTFRNRLIKAYLDLKRNASESHHDAAGIAVGKLCETVLRHLQSKLLGSFTPFGTHIPNFPDECRKLVNSPASGGTESERQIIPRALVFLYTMRNKRGIGHVGGDVDANSIDVSAMAKIADWIICELIRLYHGLSLDEAQDIVDGLAIRQLPTVWEVAGKKRVLKDGLAARDEALLLLYSSADSSVFIGDLCEWVEYSNPGVFKSKVIGPLHKARLLEFEKETESITLSPKGVAYVEDNLLG
jgi:hypothetical protein